MADDIMLRPQEPKIPKDSEFVVFDVNHPTSVINLVWPEFRQLLLHFPLDLQKYFFMGERDLRNQVHPETSLSMLRMRFWAEYDRCQITGGKIKLRDILRGCVAEDVWKDDIFPNHKKIAYLLTPPPKYLSRLEAMMNIALDEMADILALPIKDSNGKIDVKVAALKKTIWESLDVKVRGATVQKLQIDQRVMTKNIDMDSLEGLEAGLKQVQGKIAQIAGSAQQQQMIDVSAVQKEKANEVVD